MATKSIVFSFVALMALHTNQASASASNPTIMVRTTLIGIPRFVGKPVTISIRLENLRANATPLNIGYPPEFNVLIFDSKGRMINSRLPPTASRNPALGERGIILEPYEKQRFSWEWDLTDYQGKAVPNGRYCTKGEFNVTGPKVAGLESNPFCFWVVR